MYTLAFWKGTFERVLSTFCQSLLAVVSVTGVGVGEINWSLALSVGAVASLASLLKCVIAGTTGESATPSFTRAETTLNDAAENNHRAAL